ncbi:KH domain-containing protein [Patescibacteria group bacterium]|nr:KH domain-containing protein [Patescibacteria group bacterium]
MKEFIEYLLKQIVTNPDAISVTEEKEGDAFVYRIRAAQEDMGIIIGKEGRNINSLRNVAKAKAIKDNIFVKIILEENDQPEVA